jgi:hypothetical protein
MAKKNEAELTQDDVWNEHLADVNVGAHWAYIGGTLIGGLLVMLALIAVISGGS